MGALILAKLPELQSRCPVVDWLDWPALAACLILQSLVSFAADVLAFGKSSPAHLTDAVRSVYGV